MKTATATNAAGKPVILKIGRKLTGSNAKLIHPNCEECDMTTFTEWNKLSLIDKTAAELAGAYAAKKYSHETLWRLMEERDEPVFTAAWLRAYIDQVLIPQFKL